jgi:hypothetical protein
LHANQQWAWASPAKEHPMATRLPASQRTREELTALIEERLCTASGKDELVKLATRLIVEEALEGKRPMRLDASTTSMVRNPARAIGTAIGCIGSNSRLPSCSITTSMLVVGHVVARLRIASRRVQHQPVQSHKLWPCQPVSEAPAHAREYRRSARKLEALHFWLEARTGRSPHSGTGAVCFVLTRQCGRREPKLGSARTSPM